MIAFLAFTIASCIACAVYLHIQSELVRKHAEELQRKYIAARKSHRPSREIGRRLVKAKCNQLKAGA